MALVLFAKEVETLNITLTCYKQAKGCEVQPTISRHSWIPDSFHWNTLEEDHDSTKACYEDGGHNAEPDNHDVSCFNDNAKKKTSHSTLAGSNGNDAEGLTEDFPLHSSVVITWRQLPG